MKRAVVAAFCWATAIYAFLASSSFANQQFLRPRLFPALGVFSDWHHIAAVPCVLIALVSLRRELGASGAVGTLTRGFGVVWALVALWMLVHPVLPTLGDGHSSVGIGLAALGPILWRAVIDHAAARPDLLRRGIRIANDDLERSEARLLLAAIGAALFVVILYAALTPIWIGNAFEPDLLTAGLIVGLAWNAKAHLLVFCGAFLVVAVVHRAGAAITRIWLRYAIDAALFAGAVSIMVREIFCDPVGLAGPAGWAIAVACGLTMVVAWGAWGLRRLSREGSTMTSGLDAFFGVPVRRSGSRRLVSLAAIAGAAFALATLAERADWDFLILKVGVISIDLAAFALIYRQMPADRRIAGSALAFVCLAPLAGYAADGWLQARLPLLLDNDTFDVRHALDRYVVYNPSFRLMDGLLRDRSNDRPAFDRFVRANTGLDTVAIAPVDVDFVEPLEPAPGPRPHIFFFVIDSLRADYLGPYNPAVSFTPRLRSFAAESLVFRNAFTRYGATGLSVPAIWMGSSTVHKQYVQPFRPMNALETLVDGNGYRRYMNLEHIAEQLFVPFDSTVELDRGVPEMQMTFCDTIGDLMQKLQISDSGGQPIFAHTRTLDIHIAAIRNAPVPTGEAYPGFQGPYASRVRRIDACFGTFVDFLKRRGLYDKSIIILTSDHGEMLGENGEWGHVYYLSPEVLRIPLIMRLPPSMAAKLGVDLNAVAFSTDITPTLYAALGYEPHRTTWLMGEPLIAVPGADFSERRRRTEVVAASYGPVWGALAQNGRQLYVIDTIKGREQAYELTPNAGSLAVPVTAGLREASQRAIREHIDEINRVYQVNGTD